jgi:hypothetical protein
MFLKAIALMNFLRRRINPNNFVITRKQVAKLSQCDPSRILRWERWKYVLWVHIQGWGGYFISYRKLEQWIAACSTLIRSCRNIKELKVVWRAIKKEAKRYTPEALIRLEQIWQQRTGYLTSLIPHTR